MKEPRKDWRALTNKALFLDRDGIIWADKHHLYRIEDVEFIPGIFELCLHFEQRGYLIIVITNQAGIARGLYSEQDFAKLTKWMIRQFDKRGVKITKVYHCSHHPDFTGPCECRKPATKMFFEARKQFDIDMAGSINIGDKKSDIEAGLNAGIKQNILLQDRSYSYTEAADFSVINSLQELQEIWS